MEKVYEILNQIAAEPSKNGKKDIIRANVDNKLFVKVVKYALDQDKSYNLTWLPHVAETSGADVFDYLDYLSGKRGATDREAEILASRCSDILTREIVKRIINKDLRCGAKAKSFNSVMKGWVYQVPYQRYKAFSGIHAIDFENEYVVAQLKMDGMFSYFIPSIPVPFVSRNGNSYSLTQEFVDEAHNKWMGETEEIVGEPLVWMGEVLVEVNGKYLPRKTGNGIINRFISGVGDVAYEKCLRYVTWGFITLTDFDARVSKTTYDAALAAMETARSETGLGKCILMSPTTPVLDLQAALEFYRKVRARKEEGAMVKVASKLTWKDQQSGTKYGVKLKALVEAEMEIVSAEPGKAGKKYEHMMGNLIVKSSCGGILTSIGKGFSDQERELGVDFWNQQAGKIITVKFTDLITDKSDRETMCLDQSSMVETRFQDKDEADTLAYCKEAVKNA